MIDLRTNPRWDRGRFASPSPCPWQCGEYIFLRTAGKTVNQHGAVASTNRQTRGAVVMGGTEAQSIIAVPSTAKLRNQGLGLAVGCHLA